MLRYYVYFYFCSAAITAYVGFLKLRFEALDGGPWTPSWPSVDGGVAAETATGKRAKRQASETRLMGQVELSRMVDHFRRVYRAIKLRKLRRSGPSMLDLKEPTPDKTVQEGSSETRKRRKRQIEAETKVDREKKKKKKMRRRNRKRRSLWKAKTTAAPVHGAQNDVLQADPNAFFNRDEDSEVQEGVANQLFVEHWPRTLAYFLGLQVLIAAILFFLFFIYGYYKYEVWKFKESKFHAHLMKVFRLFHDPKSGESKEAEKYNAQVENMAAKAEEEEDKRHRAIERKMKKRERHTEIQKTAYRNVQMVKKERARRKAEEEEKEGKKASKKKKKAGKSKAKGKGKDDSDKESDEKAGSDAEKGEAVPQPDAAAQQGFYDPYAAYMAPGGYYPGYYPGYPQ